MSSYEEEDTEKINKMFSKDLRIGFADLANASLVMETILRDIFNIKEEVSYWHMQFKQSTSVNKKDRLTLVLLLVQLTYHTHKC